MALRQWNNPIPTIKGKLNYSILLPDVVDAIKAFVHEDTQIDKMKRLGRGLGEVNMRDFLVSIEYRSCPSEHYMSQAISTFRHLDALLLCDNGTDFREKLLNKAWEAGAEDPHEHTTN